MSETWQRGDRAICVGLAAEWAFVDYDDTVHSRPGPRPNQVCTVIVVAAADCRKCGTGLAFAEYPAPAKFAFYDACFFRKISGEATGREVERRIGLAVKELADV